jgi:hypothetical protein
VAISFFFSPPRTQKNPIFFKNFHIWYVSQIWLNYFHDDGHFWLHHHKKDSLKKGFRVTSLLFTGEISPKSEIYIY